MSTSNLEQQPPNPLLDDPWPKLKSNTRGYRIMEGGIQLGTLVQSIGEEAAKEFFVQLNPAKKATRNVITNVILPLRIYNY
jgi:hypothetical protein